MFRRLVRPTTVFDAPDEIRLDVTEDDKGNEVRAQVPGYKKEEIRVTIDGSYISITADTKRENEARARKGERTLVKELFYGSTSRGFHLERDVDEKNAGAKFKDGVLRLSVPRKQEAVSRTLSIQ